MQMRVVMKVRVLMALPSLPCPYPPCSCPSLPCPSPQPHIPNKQSQVLLFYMGGAVQRVPEASTSYALRRAKW